MRKGLVTLRNPSIILELGNKLASRVRQMTSQRSLLSLPSIPQRVCNQIWMLVHDNDAANAETISINNLPTHMEIAIMLNLSRETVTRVFQQLQKKQIVSRDGPNKLRINKVRILRKIVDGSAQI